MSQRTAPLQDSWTIVDGIPIYARVAERDAPPNHPAIVMVHGFVISSRYMFPVAERLAPYFRIYAPDLPGFGNSGEPGWVLDLDQLADALAHWMDAMEIPGRVVLLGNSFGCQIIARFAVRHPQLVLRLILVGPTVEPSRRTLLEQLLSILLVAPREELKLLTLHFPDQARAGLRRIWHTTRFILEDRIERYLPYITVPALVVRGTRDTTVSQAWAERAADLLPQGRLVVVPGAHALNFSEPRHLSRVVRLFLADMTGTDSSNGNR